MKKGTIQIDYTDSFNPKLNVILENGELWLSEYEIANLLHTVTRTVRTEIQTLLKEGLLHELEISRDERIEKNGRITITTYYNLDVLIHLCYRINTGATQLLRDWFKTKLTQKPSGQRSDELILSGTGFWKNVKRFILN